MKRIFQVNVEEKGNKLISERHEFNIVAKDITEAVKKISECISDKLEIVKSEFFCDIDEDKDLEEFKNE